MFSMSNEESIKIVVEFISDKMNKFEKTSFYILDCKYGDRRL